MVDIPMYPTASNTMKAQDALLQNIKLYLASEASSEIHALLESLHPGEQAHLLEYLEPKDRLALAHLLQEKLDGDMLAALDAMVREEMLSALETTALAHIVSSLESNTALCVLQDLPEKRLVEVLDLLTPGTRHILHAFFTYPEESAGRLMQKEFLNFSQRYTVGQTLLRIKECLKALPDRVYDLFVVDEQKHLVGTVSLKDLIVNPDTQTLKNIMHTDIYRIRYDMDQEEVALFFRQYDLVSAPVVNQTGRMIGVITIDDIVAVVQEEAQEDLLNLGGASGANFYAPILQTSLTRAHWLLIPLMSSLMSTWVNTCFETTLKESAVAHLMPIVPAMGGNAGSQVLILIVRALAMKELGQFNRWRTIKKELWVNLLNSHLFAILLLSLSYLWFQDSRISAALALATFINMFFGGLAGVLIPMALVRLKRDPGLSSGPIISTTTDVMGLFLFLFLSKYFCGISG